MSWTEFNDVPGRSSHRRGYDVDTRYSHQFEQRIHSSAPRGRRDTASLEPEEDASDDGYELRDPEQPEVGARKMHSGEISVPTRHQSTTSSRPSTISSGRSSIPGRSTSNYASTHSSMTSYSSDWTGPDTDFLYTPEARERRQLAMRASETEATSRVSPERARVRSRQRKLRAVAQGERVKYQARSRISDRQMEGPEPAPAQQSRPSSRERHRLVAMNALEGKIGIDSWERAIWRDRQWAERIAYDSYEPNERKDESSSVSGHTDDLLAKAMPSRLRRFHESIAHSTGDYQHMVQAVQDWPPPDQQDAFANLLHENRQSVARLAESGTWRSTKLNKQMGVASKRSKRYGRQLPRIDDLAPGQTDGINTSKNSTYLPDVSSVQHWLATVALQGDEHGKPTSYVPHPIVATKIEADSSGNHILSTSPGSGLDPFETWPQLPRGGCTISYGAIRTAHQPLYIISIVLRDLVAEHELPRRVAGRFSIAEGVPDLTISEAHQSLGPRKSVSTSLKSQISLETATRGLYRFRQWVPLVHALQALSHTASERRSRKRQSSVGTLQSLCRDGLAVCGMMADCNFVFQATIIAPMPKASKGGRGTSYKDAIDGRPGSRIEVEDVEEQPEQLDRDNWPSNECTAVALQATPEHPIRAIHQDPDLDSTTQKTNSFEYGLGITASPFGDPSKRWRAKYESRIIRKPAATVASVTSIANDERTVAEPGISSGRVDDWFSDYLTWKANQAILQETRDALRQTKALRLLTVAAGLFFVLSSLSFTRSSSWMEYLELLKSLAQNALLVAVCYATIVVFQLPWTTSCSLMKTFIRSATRRSCTTAKPSKSLPWDARSTERPATDLRLLEWDCACGNKAHGHYSQVEANQDSRLVKSLPNCRVVPKSKLWSAKLRRFLTRSITDACSKRGAIKSITPIGVFDTSQTHCTSSAGSSSRAAVPPPSSTGSSSSDPGQQCDTSSNASTPNVSRSDSSSSSRSSSASSLTPASSVSGASASSLASASDPKPAYFELCVNRGDMQISLGEIPLVSGIGEQLVKGDVALITEIRKRYDGLRRSGLHGYLYRPADIHWVRFGVQQRGVETGIYQSPRAIPPAAEVKEGRYHYFECPLEEMPPIAKETFFHYFWHHHEPDPSRTIFYERMPKKLGSSIFCQYDPNKLQFGWGMHIVEGPNKPLIAWIAAAIVLLSFVVAVVYDVVLKNKDSGFAIGQWMLAVLAASLAALYFHVADAV